MDFVTFLVSNILPPNLTYQKKKMFISYINIIFRMCHSYSGDALTKYMGDAYPRKESVMHFFIVTHPVIVDIRMP